ncbi:MAG TPA: hypothetical protein VJ653_02020 [Acidimicrobiales bacterium]|nr:hypothetical protein [Acidimicrobiales bacterium]
MVDAWSPHPTLATVSHSFANDEVRRRRVRVEYATEAGAAPSLALRWTPPNGVDTDLPASALAPRYSMATASTGDDVRSDVDYLSMASGLVENSSRGMVVQTSMTYKPTYLRPTTRTLGAGGGSTTTYAYDGPSEAAVAMPASPTPPPQCLTPAANQFQGLKSTGGPATPPVALCCASSSTTPPGGSSGPRWPRTGPVPPTTPGGGDRSDLRF